MRQPPTSLCATSNFLTNMMDIMVKIVIMIKMVIIVKIVIMVKLVILI